MEEALDNARDELKRVDHLFYVSLKYTRTADMMRHMVERLINTFSFGIDSLLKHAKQNKKITEIPENPVMCCKVMTQLFPEEDMIRYMNLYINLRKIMRSDYSKREEFRRHVTMTSVLDNGKVIEVSIDTLKEDYETARKFVKFVEGIVRGIEEF